MAGEFDIITIMTSLGLTPSQIAPLCILGVIAYLVFSRKIHKYLSPIKLAIVEIQTVCTTSGFELKHCLTETSSSPLHPTEYGFKLLKESGMEKIIHENREKLFQELKAALGKNPTSYDVQEKSIGIMLSNKDKSLFNPIKEYVFERGINIDVILRLGGLILRDEYLKEHSEINNK
jgi:hypothetical protein